MTVEYVNLIEYSNIRHLDNQIMAEIEALWKKAESDFLRSGANGANSGIALNANPSV